MRCPRCEFDNPPGTEICQGCKKVKFVARKSPSPATGKTKAPRATGKPAAPKEAAPKEAAPKEAPGPEAPRPTGRTPAPRPTGKAAKTPAPAPAPPPTFAPAPGPPAATPAPGGRTTVKLPPKGAKRPAPAGPWGSGALVGAAVPRGGARGPTDLAPLAPAPKHQLVRVGAPPIDLIPGQTFTFGRNDTCSLPIPSEKVSRVHAEIRWEGGHAVLADKGSANGTFVKGQPVKDHPLVAGDEIEIGPFVCVYQDGLTKAAPPADLGGKTVIDQGELLGGAITAGSLTEVLQGIDFNKKSGTLIVFSSGGQGWCTFQDGAPKAAEAGGQVDAEAIFFLLALTEGRFSFTSELRTKERRLKTTVTALLLEWGRRADEASAPGE